MNFQNQKRELSGIDIFIEAPFGAKLPQSIGQLKLSHISSRGTQLKGLALEKNILDVQWLCARYLFDISRPLSSETDTQISQAIQNIGSQYNWSSVIKLYSIEGKPQFS